jgi:hypothetical protein
MSHIGIILKVSETIQTSKTIKQVYPDDESHFRELVKKLETMSNNN